MSALPFLERHVLRDKVVVHAIRLDDHVRDVIHDREVGLGVKITR